MKLSTKARYGLRAMTALAQSTDGASGRAIAESQNLPPAYLEQLMIRLRNAKLVVSMRGAKGKFMLAKSPDQIDLAEIVEALEGPIQIADCADVPNCCLDPATCALREVFADASKALRDNLSQITLADLAARQGALEAGGRNDYRI
jgi:Rrf2 family protein